MPEPTKRTNGGLDSPSRIRRNPPTASGGGNPTGEYAAGDARVDDGATGQPETSGPGDAAGSPGIATPERIAGIGTIDPFSAGESGDDRPRKRRGRKPGTPNAKKETPDSVGESLANIERALITTCFFIGNLASCPEVHCDEDEAKKCADALREFSKYHRVPITDKLMSEINLGIVGLGFVGPRVMAVGRKIIPKPTPKPVIELARRETQPEAPGMQQQTPPPQPGPVSREVAPSAIDPFSAHGDLED